jgi:hypothetical protein
MGGGGRVPRSRTGAATRGGGVGFLIVFPNWLKIQFSLRGEVVCFPSGFIIQIPLRGRFPNWEVPFLSNSFDFN